MHFKSNGFKWIQEVILAANPFATGLKPSKISEPGPYRHHASGKPYSVFHFGGKRRLNRLPVDRRLLLYSNRHGESPATHQWRGVPSDGGVARMGFELLAYFPSRNVAVKTRQPGVHEIDGTRPGRGERACREKNDDRSRKVYENTRKRGKISTHRGVI